MQIPRWINVTLLRNSSSYSSSHCASFHSTPASLAKWKNKWNPDSGKVQQPSKNYVRYATRQKRADAKKALKDLLFKSGSPKVSFQDVDPWNINYGANEANNSHDSNKTSRSKKSSAKVRRSSHTGKGKSRRENFSNDFDQYPETIFQATFGSRCYTWSFRPWGDCHFQSSSTGFEWRDNSNWTNSRRKAWNYSSETDDDDDNDNDESCTVGSYSDRTTLGLPPTGPLKMEDVKSAFRSSALKWHPDKHQGPSQTMAGEKFKVCVDAYKSLCNALSST